MTFLALAAGQQLSQSQIPLVHAPYPARQRRGVYILIRAHQLSSMEHYGRKQSHYITEQRQENELQVTSAGKSRDIATKVMHMIEEKPAEGVIISASGSHVTKAVTVAEMIKRRLPGLLQSTEIKYVKVEDVWEPTMEGLDTLKVTRKIPAISISLSGGQRSKDSPSHADSHS